MLRAFIILSVFAVAAPFIISLAAPMSKVGLAVSSRFLERSNSVPIEPEREPIALNGENLKAWVTGEKTAMFASSYAWRVIPLDFAYIIVLSGFLALGSYLLSHEPLASSAIVRLPGWIWFVLPATYAITDLLEDALIFSFMLKASWISDRTVELLAFLRTAKIGSNILAMAQLVGLGIAGGMRE